MVATPETLNRFIFNSDYPIDKVVWLYEGSTTSPSSAGVTNTITINTEDIFKSKVPVYVKGVFTIDDWQTSYMIGVNQPTTDTNKFVTMSINWGNYPNAYIDLGVSSRTAGSVSKPVKYRLWGVIREDTRSAVDYGKNSSITKSKLIFNSENNYPRLYKDGIAKSGDTVKHNLHKIPYIDYWWNWSENEIKDSWIYNPSGQFKTSPSTPTVTATDTDITFSKLSGSDVWYYYRLYA